jgi:hypothetical protein
MKIRSGFVSNSSSSSFILIANKEEFEKAVKKCHPFIKHVSNEIFEDKKILNQDVKYCFIHESTEDPWEYNLNEYTGNFLDSNGNEIEINEDYLIFPSTVVQEIISKMKKKDYYTDYTDC